MVFGPKAKKLKIGPFLAILGEKRPFSYLVNFGLDESSEMDFFWQNPLLHIANLI